MDNEKFYKGDSGKNSYSRRKFLKTTVAASAAFTIIPGVAMGKRLDTRRQVTHLMLRLSVPAIRVPVILAASAKLKFPQHNRIHSGWHPNLVLRSLLASVTLTGVTDLLKGPLPNSPVQKSTKTGE